MASPNEIVAVERYNPLSRLLHWLVAGLVLVVFPLGFVIRFIKDDYKMTFYMFHEGLGFIILWVMILRLLIKLVTRQPAEIAMPGFFAKAARYTHIGLYTALILQPISGFLANSANGFPLNWFGLGEIWSPLGKSDGLAPILGGMHYILGLIILVLFVLHMGGVLFHHLIRRDATLYRII